MGGPSAQGCRQAPLTETLLPVNPVCEEGSRKRQTLRARAGAVKLDFEARVPVPFSIFPSAYRDVEQKESVTTTQSHEEVDVHLPHLHHHRPGREGSHVSSHSASVAAAGAAADLPYHRDGRYTEEEIRIIRDARDRRPGVHREEFIVHEELKEQQSRPARSSHVDTRIEIDAHRHHDHHSHHEHDQHFSPIDKIEREYRARYQPGYREDVRVTESVVDGSHHHQHQRRPAFKETTRVEETVVDGHRYRRPASSVTETVRVDETVVDGHRYRRPASSFKETVRVDETVVDGHRHHHRRPAIVKETVRIDETVEAPRIRPSHHKDTICVEETVKTAPAEHRQQHHCHQAKMGYFDKDVTIPCHHIRIGDILMLQGHPCQVIRISSSAATGQHRYLGVDLFSKQLHEESSQVHNPAPSVVVQTMRGPVLKQYRVLDLQDGQVVAMTETGDVKQALAVSEQADLWSRLTKAFDSGRGSVRVLVVHHQGQEMAVDVKTLHGSSL